MKKKRTILLFVIALIIVSGSILIALQQNKNASKKFQTHFIDELLEEKSTSGIIFLIKKDGNRGYVFVEDKTEKEFKILINRNMIKHNIRTYLNMKINMRFKYNPNKKNSKENKHNEQLSIRNIEDIKIIYNEIELTGRLSLRGSPPKLTLTTGKNDNKIAYEFDKKQKNYQEIVDKYQGYNVKIIGKYFSRIFTKMDSSKLERRYLIVDKIEKL